MIRHHNLISLDLMTQRLAPWHQVKTLRKGVLKPASSAISLIPLRRIEDILPLLYWAYRDYIAYDTPFTLLRLTWRRSPSHRLLTSGNTFIMLQLCPDTTLISAQWSTQKTPQRTFWKSMHLLSRWSATWSSIFSDSMSYRLKFRPCRPLRRLLISHSPC